MRHNRQLSSTTTIAPTWGGGGGAWGGGVRQVFIVLRLQAAWDTQKKTNTGSWILLIFDRKIGENNISLIKNIYKKATILRRFLKTAEFNLHNKIFLPKANLTYFGRRHTLIEISIEI